MNNGNQLNLRLQQKDYNIKRYFNFLIFTRLKR